ncbi:uncharacterized protein LOC114727942 [Neltuma alba]|uniref:uncharacterized protein LOC114727942 n=1 Tax=Neltuma alba TaxID=207710 RepID=UPI0010A5581F|nr:uncharacterized protein LOC114727942 [Prosopis alba]
MFYLILWGKRIPVPERHQGPVKALVFVVICSISVLLDKLVPGNSDGWSIISYASFALMSLFTSRKSELGFETGFFSFFLSLFVEQLCKTNLKLSPIAVVFCLVVLILRHYSASGVQSGSIAPNGYHHVGVGPPNAAVIDIGDDDESQDSLGMGEVSGQSLLSARNQQNNQEEPSQSSQDDRVMGEVSGQSLSSTTIQQNHNQEQPSQAQNNEDEENRPLLPDTHRSSGMEEISEESTPERGDEHNNEAEEDPSSLAAVSWDQDHVPSGNSHVIIQIEGTPELRYSS